MLSLPAVQDAQPRAGVHDPVPLPDKITPGDDQGLPGSWGTSCAYALFSDPGRTDAPGQYVAIDMAPVRATTKAPRDSVISGLNGTASALAVYASSSGLPAPGRKTRFWLLAKLYRAGLATRRVPIERFRQCSLHHFPPSQAFPGARTQLVFGRVFRVRGGCCLIKGQTRTKIKNYSALARHSGPGSGHQQLLSLASKVPEILPRPRA